MQVYNYKILYHLEDIPEILLLKLASEGITRVEGTV